MADCFFPAVVAPTVFKSLPGAEAGHFLRALFPRYYLFLSQRRGRPRPRALRQAGPAAAAVAVSTAAVLLLLVPKINAFGIGNWQEMMLRAELLIEPTAYP